MLNQRLFSRQRLFKNLAHLCRTILAITFIFSGVVKTVDPWGTALKVSEYLTIYGWDSLQGYVMPFSIWMCGAELMMGLMLLFKVRIRLVSIFAVCSMLIFTVITFLSATVLPVEDCGCFGEAMKLTPWLTFFKNLALLPLALVVWWRYRRDRIFSFSKLELMCAAIFFSVAMGLGIYCYYHLPVIDFLPYKVGVHIADAMQEEQRAQDEEVETVLVYRNLKNGRIKEFQLDDTEWQDESKWEWVDTRIESDKNVVKALISEFALHNAEGDATEEVLATKGRLYMLCLTRLDRIPNPCEERLIALTHEALKRGESVICLTPDPLYDRMSLTMGEVEIPCYNIDASTMKTMLRARNGVVVLDDGTIVAKYNCRDIPTSEQMK
ncbi:MAG: DoxX protein [Alistipes sp.]|nr:DoxX protein [Alistipes sp.]